MNNKELPFICPEHGKVFHSRKRSTDINYAVKTPCKYCNKIFKDLHIYLKTKENFQNEDLLIQKAKQTSCTFYIIKILNFYKYGLTSKSIQERYKYFNEPYEIIQEIPCDLYTCILLENILDKYSADNALKYYATELSKVGGCTECYKL